MKSISNNVLESIKSFLLISLPIQECFQSISLHQTTKRVPLLNYCIGEIQAIKVRGSINTCWVQWTGGKGLVEIVMATYKAEFQCTLIIVSEHRVVEFFGPTRELDRGSAHQLRKLKILIINAGKTSCFMQMFSTSLPTCFIINVIRHCCSVI